MTYGSTPTAYLDRRQAAALAGGTRPVPTSFAVGDGGGAIPALSTAGGGLTNEIYRAAVTSAVVNPTNPTQVDITCVVPDTVPEFVIREVAVFDETGSQIGAATWNSNKPSGASYIFIFTLAFGNTDGVPIAPPAGVFATKAYVDAAINNIQITPYTGTEGVKIVDHQASLDYPDLPPDAAIADNDLLALFNALLGKYESTTVAQFAAAIASRLPAAAVVPSGTIIHVAQAKAPVGYLKANGNAVSRATYANLFAAIGTTFGAGDGATTFNLPDLRGEFIRSLDDGRGIDAGRAIGSDQPELIGPHNHPATTTGTTDSQGTHTHAATTTASILNGNGGTAQIANQQDVVVPGISNVAPTVTIAPAGAHSHNLTAQTQVSNNAGTENRPRNVALLACIKF